MLWYMLMYVYPTTPNLLLGSSLKKLSQVNFSIWYTVSQLLIALPNLNYWPAFSNPNFREFHKNIFLKQSWEFSELMSHYSKHHCQMFIIRFPFLSLRWCTDCQYDTCTYMQAYGTIYKGFSKDLPASGDRLLPSDMFSSCSSQTLWKVSKCDQRPDLPWHT